jgi:hypothetical protein
MTLLGTATRKTPAPPPTWSNGAASSGPSSRAPFWLAWRRETALSRSRAGTRFPSIACSIGVLDERDAPRMKETRTSGQAFWPPLHANQASPRAASRPTAFMASNIVRRS